MVGTKPVLQLALDVPVADMQAASPLPFGKSCIEGVCWYEIDKSANDQNLPSVVFSQQGATIRAENVINISSVVNEQYGQSVQNLKFTLRGLPDNSSHEKNIDFIYGIINELIAQGWRHYYYPSSPRIPGSEAIKLSGGETVFGEHVRSHPWFDPSIKMSLDQWLSYPSVYEWHFYQHGVYLTLEVMRSDSEKDPKKNGNYLVSLAVQNESDFWHGHFEEKDMARWVTLLPGLLDRYHAKRAASEAKARANGIKIDETYQDPPIKALGQ
ncbi:hypothetical protein [Pseudomonas baltica]|uniref:hypothetical protein n=1 Tax=Pseudomonas baltica TaxID=2762576 RepID=UPI0028976D00|nr:hypothetical protein [Pseudomonas baltica]